MAVDAVVVVAGVREPPMRGSVDARCKGHERGTALKSRPRGGGIRLIYSITCELG